MVLPNVLRIPMVANRISAKWVHIFNFKMVFENKDHFLVKKLCAVHCAFILYGKLC